MAKTIKEMYQQILSHTTDTEEIEFLQGRIEKLDAKKANAKPTKKQAERQVLTNAIYDEMVAGTDYTASGMVAQLASCKDLSAQSVTASLNALVADGKVVRSYEKRVAHFVKVTA